jgi:hypothetical protein
LLFCFVSVIFCTGDTKGIDDVIEHVQLMVEPVETAMFDVFDQVHAPQWKALRAHFFAENEKVKAATRELIDTSFRKLRSAEGAFELLQVRLQCERAYWMRGILSALCGACNSSGRAIVGLRTAAKLM